MVRYLFDESVKLPKNLEAKLSELVADPFKYLKTYKIVLDTSYEVSYLAGYSVNGKVIYIDKRLPRHLKLRDGRVIDVYKYLLIHEMGEKLLEDIMDYKYPYAHEFATGKLERKAVENDKIEWDEYQDYMLKEVKKLKTFHESPPDLDTKPEKDTHDYHRFHKIEKLKKKEREKEAVISFFKQVASKYKVQALTVGKFIIPEKLEPSLQLSGDLTNAKNWKAKVILGNSGKVKRGKFEAVGYVGFEPRTATLVPIARSDEHHTGYDYLDYLQTKKIIPKGKYTTIWVLSGTNYAHDDDHIKELIPVYKKWLQLGGTNLRISTRGEGHDKYMSFKDLVAGGAWKDHQIGTLTAFGKELVTLLEKIAVLYKKAITSQKMRPPTKQLGSLLFDLAQFGEDHRQMYSHIEGIEKAAASIVNGEDIDKNMQIIFGFNGVKNELHNELRKAVKEKNESYNRNYRDAQEFWGDPEFALEEFNRLSSI